jgi:circadian clock protein KaiC
LTQKSSPAAVQPKLRAKTGVSGLDDILGGGLPAGHLYLIQADPGSGKTTLGLQFLLEGLKNGEPTLYITLSESKDELNGVALSHGWDISQMPMLEMIPEEQEVNPEAQYTVFHPSEVELADTTSTVLKKVQEIRPKRIIFDSLAELQMLARDPLRYRRHILGLKKFFTGLNCTVLLLDDRSTVNNDLQLQSIAHGVIIMEGMQRDFGVRRRRIEVKKLRGTKYREGFHDYVIQTGGLEVYPRLVAAEHTQQAKSPEPISSGIKELDTLTGGGIDAGTSTLLLGPAGCGKSTIATRYVLAAAERGDNCVIYTFDETRDIMLHRSKGLGMDLTGHLKSGRVIVEQVDPAELAPGEFVARVFRQVAERNVKVVVIDSLNGFMHSMPAETVLTMQMHELLSFLNHRGVATLMTLAQHGLMGSNVGTTTFDLSYLADSVLLFRYFESHGDVKRALSVVKKRSGAHEQTIRELKMEGGKIVIGDALRQFQGVFTGVPQLVTAKEAGK